MNPQARKAGDMVILSTLAQFWRNAVLTRITAVMLLAIMSAGCSGKSGQTTLEYLGPSTNKVTKIRHERYRLCEVRHGIFLGMCPTTTQIQWSYYITLTGEGPGYATEQIELEQGGSGDMVKVVSGKVQLEQVGRAMAIDVQIEQAGATNRFAHNGTYRIEASK